MSENVNNISLQNLEKHLPKSLFTLLDRRNCTALLLDELPKTWMPEAVSPQAGEPKTLEQRLWELIGLYIRKKRGAHEAIAIFMSLYDYMLFAQEKNGYRVHKGMPLVWICECFRKINCSVHAKRYLMLTLCEDALTYHKGGG